MSEDLRSLLLDAFRELVEAVEPSLGKMNYYFGPGARVLVSKESVDAYRRIKSAVEKAREALNDV